MRRKVKHPKPCAEMKGQRVVVLSDAVELFSGQSTFGRIATVTDVTLDGYIWPIIVRLRSNGKREDINYAVNELGWLLEWQ